MPFKVLHFSLVLLCGNSRGKRSEVPPFVSLRIYLSRIQPVLAGFQFANHVLSPVVGFALPSIHVEQRMCPVSESKTVALSFQPNVLNRTDPRIDSQASSWGRRRRIATVSRKMIVPSAEVQETTRRSAQELSTGGMIPCMSTIRLRVGVITVPSYLLSNLRQRAPLTDFSMRSNFRRLCYRRRNHRQQFQWLRAKRLHLIEPKSETDDIEGTSEGCVEPSSQTRIR
jgi:hypothetical protein